MGGRNQAEYAKRKGPLKINFLTAFIGALFNKNRRILLSIKAWPHFVLSQHSQQRPQGSGTSPKPRPYPVSVEYIQFGIMAIYLIFYKWTIC